MPARTWKRALPVLAAPQLERLIPAIVVTALLGLAAAAPTRRPAVPAMPSPTPGAAPCVEFSHTGGSDDAILCTAGSGLLQPLPDGVTLAACSLSVTSGTYGSATLRVHEFDPATLAPDPETVALRTQAVAPSSFSYVNGFAMPWITFVPPIITGSLQHVAEPPRSTLAIDTRSNTNGYYSPLTASYAQEGSPEFPAASFIPAGGSTGSLDGSHPVLAHALCSGDDALQSLRVAQSVRRTNVTLGDRPAELVQRFRVPEAVVLRWIEVAEAVVTTGVASAVIEPDMPAPAPPVIAIVDPEGAAGPPTTMPPSLVEATLSTDVYNGYYGNVPFPRWASHLDFDHTIVLQPGHDYWLYLRDASPLTLYGRALTGSEGGDFTAGVGAFHTRTGATAAWTPATDKVLAFKIVGLPISPTGVPPHPNGFLMQVAPNPVNDVAKVTWSGAVGPVRFEVFDPRGRRVGHGEGGAAGTWAWVVTGRDGRPLPAGVYFIHARDTAGGHIVRQVVIVR